ncbi:OsmC family protein [Mucilaginibacter boryungensis]|uniref:OsmC family protein n=1 Tax=Mucilaginibacter boryungensis TaxID=768480 RepID=A0ABR9XIH8_9SPHI|nr:OsmC family protein [Mucilaginibacter boryungensis]MBE9667031.1 OsmC family protein [Mucilaginibacter boryungensis]
MSDNPEALATVRAIITHTQYQTIVTSGKHTVIADEPEDLEGGDTGMSPNELLLASLSSCTAITLQMYIKRKMWVVDDITLDLSLHQTETGILIKTDIKVKGQLNDEQIKRLTYIADVCPVHKMLVGEIVIATNLVKA